MRYVLGALLLFPTISLAAGFASESIFLSKSPVTEGDSVRIYAVVANPTGTKFVGQVVVKEGETTIGSASVTMDAGGTQTVSVPWKPVSGSHTVIELLETTDGVTVESKSKVFAVNPKPKPVATSTTPESSSNGTIQNSDPLQNQITELSPAVGSAVKPAFTSIDSLRGKIAGVADEQLGSTKKKLDDPSTGSIWKMLWTVYFYLLTLLRYIIGNVGVFYPVLAVAFFYLLWRVFRRIRRPS